MVLDICRGPAAFISLYVASGPSFTAPVLTVTGVMNAFALWILGCHLVKANPSREQTTRGFTCQLREGSSILAILLLLSLFMYGSGAMAVALTTSVKIINAANTYSQNNESNLS